MPGFQFAQAQGESTNDEANSDVSHFRNNLQSIINRNSLKKSPSFLIETPLNQPSSRGDNEDELYNSARRKKLKVKKTILHGNHKHMMSLPNVNELRENDLMDRLASN